ncbi:MAG: vitamin K epoxide reductase family protein [Pseudomonadota bacterium]
MNKRRKPNGINFIWAILITSMLQSFSLNAQAPIVHALLFYSPACPHCHKVLSEDIPPLHKKYGEQLRIVVVNTQQADGQALYQAAIKHFHIPDDRIGVPTLIVGNQILVGSNEIPTLFPELIESFLAQGGIDWPPIPGLTLGLASEGRAVPPSQAGTLSEKLARDPIGNGLAIIVLIGMLIVVLHTFVRLKQNPQPLAPDWIIPLLSLLGLAVAAYMLYIEKAQIAAVCGPIGDCNTVQQSEYAHLFGVIPLSVLGVIAYLAILLTWSIAHYSSGKLANRGRLALFTLTLSGTLFSIYLTFLEPFVIGATCAWCLASAIIITVLLWRTRL